MRAWAAESAADSPVPAFIRNQAANDRAYFVRAETLAAIVTSWRWEADPEMAQFIRDRSVKDRATLARITVLTKIAESWSRYGPEVHSFVRERAAKDPSPAVREAVLRAISQPYGTENSAFLRKLATEDPNPSVRLAALAQILDLYFVAERAAIDTDLTVVKGALRLIAQRRSGYPPVAALVDPLVGSHDVPAIRQAALAVRELLREEA